MAKININFNDKDYSIDEASFSTATTSLRNHLSTVMNGSGATVNLGGTSYNIDSAKLSTTRNTFVSHLSTIAGSGHKVVVGGVEYGVASDKVSGAISELETVLSDLNIPIIEGGAVLKVKKKHSVTYADDIIYNEQNFILLDIYPKTNGTVSVTYGGLTKTITDTSGAASPAAQQVFFGTFNGVSDSVETPDSGILTIEGDYRSFGAGVYKTDFANSRASSCITAVYDLGDITFICDNAFKDCDKIESITIPEGVTSIGNNAFENCGMLKMTSLPNSLRSIGRMAFSRCSKITLTSLPPSLEYIYMRAFFDCSGLSAIEVQSDRLKNIHQYAFQDCSNLTSFTFKDKRNWYVNTRNELRGGGAISVNVDDPENTATLLTDTYVGYYWIKS